MSNTESQRKNTEERSQENSIPLHGPYLRIRIEPEIDYYEDYNKLIMTDEERKERRAKEAVAEQEKRIAHSRVKDLFLEQNEKFKHDTNQPTDGFGLYLADSFGPDSKDLFHEEKAQGYQGRKDDSEVFISDVDKRRSGSVDLTANDHDDLKAARERDLIRQTTSALLNRQELKSSEGMKHVSAAHLLQRDRSQRFPHSKSVDDLSSATTQAAQAENLALSAPEPVELPSGGQPTHDERTTPNYAIDSTQDSDSADLFPAEETKRGSVNLGADHITLHGHGVISYRPGALAKPKRLSHSESADSLSPVVSGQSTGGSAPASPAAARVVTFSSASGAVLPARRPSSTSPEMRSASRQSHQHVAGDPKTRKIMMHNFLTDPDHNKFDFIFSSPADICLLIKIWREGQEIQTARNDYPKFEDEQNIFRRLKEQRKNDLTSAEPNTSYNYDDVFLDLLFLSTLPRADSVNEASILDNSALSLHVYCKYFGMFASTSQSPVLLLHKLGNVKDKELKGNVKIAKGIVEMLLPEYAEQFLCDLSSLAGPKLGNDKSSIIAILKGNFASMELSKISQIFTDYPAIKSAVLADESLKEKLGKRRVNGKYNGFFSWVGSWFNICSAYTPDSQVDHDGLSSMLSMPTATPGISTTDIVDQMNSACPGPDKTQYNLLINTLTGYAKRPYGPACIASLIESLLLSSELSSSDHDIEFIATIIANVEPESGLLDRMHRYLILDGMGDEHPVVLSIYNKALEIQNAELKQPDIVNFPRPNCITCRAEDKSVNPFYQFYRGDDRDDVAVRIFPSPMR